MIARDTSQDGERSSALPQLTEDDIDDVLYAVRTNDQPDLDAILSQLSSRHASPQSSILAAATSPDSGNSALHYAAANGLTPLLAHLLSLLASSSSLVNARNAAGSTPLHWAALNGQLDAVKLLVSDDVKADVWARNQAGNLAVFEAERAGHDAVVAELLRAGGGGSEGGAGEGSGVKGSTTTEGADDGEAGADDEVVMTEADLAGSEALEEGMANARIDS